MQQYGVYEISKATLTASRNPRYAIGAYEMKLDHNTVVQPLPENAQGAMKIPKVQYNFRNIKEIETLMKDTSIDVMGVVHEVSPISMQMLRTGGEKAKRSIKLRDDSSAEVELTLWGEHADGLGQSSRRCSSKTSTQSWRASARASASLTGRTCPSETTLSWM